MPKSYTQRQKEATIVPFEQSDLPCSDLHGLSHDETLLIFSRRFKEAGEPWDLLQNWLDDRYIGSRNADPQARVLMLDHFGMSALMREAREWAHPPGANGEFE